MISSQDIPSLRDAAERALKGERSRGVAGGWSASDGKGRVYTGASFPFEGHTWVVVRGPQRPAAAQLLDATAWFKHATKGADFGLALLDREKKEPRHRDASESFRSRYQAAVWRGLEIVAVETAGKGQWSWEPAKATECPEKLDSIAKEVKREIEAHRREPRWAETVRSGKSVRAEPLVCEVVTRVLVDHGFEPAPKREREFHAMWRRGKADGLWVRKGEPRTRIALEMKITEDMGAPFCQAFDDLGEFDAVLYVRLIGEGTRAQAQRLSGLNDLKLEVQERLPLRFIDVHCAG